MELLYLSGGRASSDVIESRFSLLYSAYGLEPVHYGTVETLSTVRAAIAACHNKPAIVRRDNKYKVVAETPAALSEYASALLADASKEAMKIREEVLFSVSIME